MVKVESPEGNGARNVGDSFLMGYSDYVLSLNLNKRSIIIELKNEERRGLVFLGLLQIVWVIFSHFREQGACTSEL